MKRKNRRKFFKKENRNLALLNNRDRVLHSFCYTESGLIIESLIFDEPQSDPFDNDLRLSGGQRAIGFFGFEDIEAGIFGNGASALFKGKYAIDDVVDFPMDYYGLVAKRHPDNQGSIPYYGIRRGRFEKRRVVDIEIACDSVRKGESQIIYIIYHTVQEES